MTEAVSRSEIVAAARAWIGTPYRHQAACKGAGCDCLGLVRGVWREVHGAEPEEPPPYSPDWGEAGAVEHILEAAARHMTPIALQDARAADVIVFRMREGRIAKHMAIVSGPGSMIHAQAADCVREIALTPYWRRHIVAAFAFPGIVDQ
ncbi:NlpC/P60 family protein [Methylosinus sp. Ce-a6]|uniref:NlpC/P60 family protein n=1 Tax=Methylosinus sp. Ce-a6 TaxID=2172005 RepID=UPI00135C2465|nr:NlpC/P60 family protein [Methylosinus sp. Ce-a6]